MKYVLDQNFLHSQDLINILENKNDIILIDDFFIEQFKSSNPEIYFEKNIKVLLDFPEQLFLAFDRASLLHKEYAKCNPIDKNEIIDDNRTEFIRNLFKKKDGIKSIDFKKWKFEAEQRIKQESNLPDFFKIPSEKLNECMKKEGTKDEYRNNHKKRICDIQETVFQVIEKILKEKCHTKCYPELFKQTLSINYAQVFIHLWRVVDWTLKDGYQNAKKAISGDGFDIKYILISSFFDDLLTNEQWMKECRNELLNVF